MKTGWMGHGVCQENPRLWDMHAAPHSHSPKAIEGCLSCPVLDDCREWALTDDMFPLLINSGVIAAMSNADREREYGKRVTALNNRRLCLHCEKPLAQGSHPNRTIHAGCKTAHKYRARFGDRRCRQCQDPVGPRKHLCATCANKNQQERIRRNNRKQSARRSALRRAQKEATS